MLKESLRKLKDVQDYPCVTLLLNTPFTEAENRSLKEFQRLALVVRY